MYNPKHNIHIITNDHPDYPVLHIRADRQKNEDELFTKRTSSNLICNPITALNHSRRVRKTIIIRLHTTMQNLTVHRHKQISPHTITREYTIYQHNFHNSITYAYTINAPIHNHTFIIKCIKPTIPN